MRKIVFYTNTCLYNWQIENAYVLGALTRKASVLFFLQKNYLMIFQIRGIGTYAHSFKVNSRQVIQIKQTVLRH